MLFSHWTDLLHFFLGVVAGVLLDALPIVSLFILCSFVVYQALQREPSLSSVIDCVELLTGFAVGLAMAGAFGIEGPALERFASR